METAQRAATVPSQGLAESLAHYLEARGLLLSLEANEAFQQILRVTVFILIAGLAAFTGWLLLVGSLVGLMMARFHWSWPLATAVAGAGNLLVAMFLIKAAHHHLVASHWWADTLKEFKNDCIWLRQLTTKH